MNKIPFVDLRSMHEELRSELLDDFNRVVFESSNFIRGNEDLKFEKQFAEYCDAKYCVGVGTGLDAIYLLLKAFGIKSGDEVIIPSNTYIATALAVSYTGAIPVFVEPEIETYNIDVSKIEEKITDKTKCIIPVHLQGRPADLDPITEIANRYNLHIIDDAAQAHGAKYKKRRIGSLCEATAWSFYPGKNLGALGDAGCITTNNKELAEKVKSLGDYGSDYKYHHIYKGTNSRLDELQAAFLSSKLKKLDIWNEERRRIAAKYLTGITNPLINLPLPVSEDFEHVYHVFAIRCDHRDKLEQYLFENNIVTLKHYPIPIHLQGAYYDLNIHDGDLPIAEEISRTVLSLPMYYGLRDEEIEYVIDSINSFSF